MLRNISILVQLEWKKFIRFAALILMALSLGFSFVRCSPSSRNSGRLPLPKMRPRDLHGNAGTGRSLSLEHPRTRRKRYRLFGRPD